MRVNSLIDINFHESLHIIIVYVPCMYRKLKVRGKLNIEPVPLIPLNETVLNIHETKINSTLEVYDRFSNPLHCSPSRRNTVRSSPLYCRLSNYQGLDLINDRAARDDVTQHCTAASYLQSLTSGDSEPLTE